jgi:predicted secreted protein
MIIKGQNLRIFLNGHVLAVALNCSVSLQNVMKDVSNKDSVGGWAVNRVFSQNWSVQGECVISESVEYGDVLSDVKNLVGTKVQVDFSVAGGEHNAEMGDILVTGNAIVSDISITAQNRQRGTYQIKLTGSGRVGVPVLLADNAGVVLCDSDGVAFTAY